MIVHVLSGWLASSYLIWRAFLQHISWRVSVKSVINKRKSSYHFAWRNGSIAACMDVYSSYWVRRWYWTWKAFLSIKNYFYQHQNITIIIKGESETCPKVYRFIWSCCILFYYWTCFSRLAALVCFLAVIPFVIFRILLQQLQKKTSSQKYSLHIGRNAKHWGLIEDYVGKFNQETNGSKLSKRWLAQLSENPVDCVCGRSLFTKQENFFSAVFLKQFFHQKGTL